MEQSEKENLAMELLEFQHSMIFLGRIGEYCSVSRYNDPTGETYCKRQDGDQGIVSRVHDGVHTDPLAIANDLENRISEKIQELDDPTSDPFLEKLKKSVEKIKFIIDN